MWIRSLIYAGLLLGAGLTSAAAGPLPDGFVYLRDVFPEIRQDMRYAGRDNFMRRRLPGYQAGECVLTEQAAVALGRVQEAAVSQGYSLVVFDCYRPQSAVDAMVAWVTAARGGQTDPDYFPHVSRSQLIRQGYIGPKSSHAKGSTVDLALEPLGGPGAGSGGAGPCSRTDRGTADFGTPFDCFDPASRTASNAVPGAARDMRQKLVALMRQGGFKNYPGEWWHFTLQGEPFPGRAFDFPIRRR